MTKAVDLFAGWGGFTEGARMAGVDVVWAANHWPLAVEAHAANHPDAVHVCQDLRQANWSRLPAHDVLLAAPACQGHSTASQPKRRAYHDDMRATAWAVVDAVDVTEPRLVVVENVPAFRRWRLYPMWRAALERMGYAVAELVERASHHGVPQRRERFIVAGKGRDATRMPQELAAAVASRRAAEPAFGPCVDWQAPGWRSLSATTNDVRARVERSRARHGDRFLTQHVTNHPGVPLDEPIRTITTKDQWAVVDGDQYRPLTIRETARGMGFPESYAWPARATRVENLRGLGNAVPPGLARDMIAAALDAA